MRPFRRKPKPVGSIAGYLKLDATEFCAELERSKAAAAALPEQISRRFGALRSCITHENGPELQP